jgi:hypothetical protein
MVRMGSQRLKPSLALSLLTATIARSSAPLHEVRHSAAMGDGIATQPPRVMTEPCDLVEMHEGRRALTRATLTEQVRERSFVNHGYPAATRGSVLAFTRRPSA